MDGDGDNMGYLPNMPSYDPNVSYGSSSGDYWQQSFAQHDPQPTNSAPFFQNQQDAFLMGNQDKSASMFTFTGAPTQTYRPYPINTMPSYTPSDYNPARKSQTGLETLRVPPSKRQRMTTQVGYDSPPAGPAVIESDHASLCGTQSECCSSCSGGIACDEPDCSPCDEVNCVGAAVEVCSVASCSVGNGKAQNFTF